MSQENAVAFAPECATENMEPPIPLARGSQLGEINAAAIREALAQRRPSLSMFLGLPRCHV
jgi:hypothetical protein